MDISLFSAVSYQKKTQYKIQIGKYSLHVIVGIDLANRIRSDPVDPNLNLDKYNYFSIWFEVPGCPSFYPSEEEYSPFIINLGLQQAGSTLAHCCFKEVRWHQLEAIYDNMVRLSNGTNSSSPVSTSSTTIIPSSIQKKREEKGCKSCRQMSQ